MPLRASPVAVRKLERTGGAGYGRTMQRLALALAGLAVLAVSVRAPGPYLAIGLGIAAIGTGWVGYGRRAAPGMRRLAAAAAITLGAIALLLGAARVVIALAALDHVSQLIAS
jgi:hypothetical protein